MKIADYTRVWAAHGLGGMQIRSSLVAKGLAQRGHEVHVFTTSQENCSVREACEEGVHVHYIEGSVPKQYSPEYFQGAFRLFEAIGQFDVVHSNSSAAHRHLGGAVPLVATWHGIGTDWDDSNLIKIGNRPRHSKFDDSILQYDHSIVISLHEQRLLVERGLPAERVHLVYHGLDETCFAPNEAGRSSLRNDLGVGKDEFIVGLSGRLVYDKGVEQLAAAAPMLPPRIKVLVVGDGPSLGVLERSLGPRVMSVKSSPHAEMPKYYRAMDLFVNPTARHQGFDLTTMEAMLCGTPVLVSDVNTAREVLVEGAEFFELGNIPHLSERIQSLASSGCIPFLGQEARALALQMFTKKRMLDQVEDLFCKLSVDRTYASRKCQPNS